MAFEIKLTDEQYEELAQFWHEYMVLGPPRSDMGATHSEIALHFSEWIDAPGDDEPVYGLHHILAFFDEKERREGTAIPQDEGEREAQERRARAEYETALREGGYYQCFPERDT